MTPEKVHFIAVGGSIMHNLALALQKKGLIVSGSDDELFEPSKSRLSNSNIVSETGWKAEKITNELDAVIVGMHAKKDNPELLKAQELQIPIYSFPEYIYNHSIDKQRIVIAGSHGKTTITAMVLHVLKKVGKKCDYAVGAQLEGFDTMVQLTDAPIIVIEGDEYLSSPLDSKPKFLNYHHHILVLNGISWDHMNVFPNFDDYVQQFETLANTTPKAGTIIYNEKDKLVKKIASEERDDVILIPYKSLSAKYKNGKTFISNGKDKINVDFFGEHNMINANAAKEVCARVGVKDHEFYEAIASFPGASKRLELLGENEINNSSIYKDFAHAPSKLLASCSAMKERFSDRKLIACVELHTFSSLNKEFLPQYKNTFEAADEPLIFINSETLKNKGLDAISEKELQSFFNNDKIRLFNDASLLEDHLLRLNWTNTNLLLMSSGNFGNLNFSTLTSSILKD